MSSRAGESVAIKLTGDAASAIAVIEISGPEVQPWIERHWSPNSGIRTLDINAIRYGSIEHFDTTDSETAFAESVILCRTGPDQFELHCHGGELASQSILTKLASEGFHIQPSSTWIREHSEDEFSAEATQALLKAKTTQTARILLDQQRGALSNAVATIEQAISSGDFTTAKSKIQELRNWGQIGLHLLTPFQVLLCGPPNVGKSSLMNRVLGYQRAIVHEQAGTTRDLLEEETSFSGWPVKLLDSAGVRVAENKIEQQGIERTLAASDRVDLQWILVDPQQG